MEVILHLNDDESAILRRYAETRGATVSDALRDAFRIMIEEEADVAAYEKAYAEYLADPVTYSLAEIEGMLADGTL